MTSEFQRLIDLLAKDAKDVVDQKIALEKKIKVLIEDNEQLLLRNGILEVENRRLARAVYGRSPKETEVTK